MSAITKIQLSNLEKDLIKNKEWILTKHTIIKKVYDLFGDVHIIYKSIYQNENFPSLKFSKKTTGKISKGENYLGLPYVILDYPSSFSKEEVFAIRTLFWWGNFFSISLHLSGPDVKIKKNIKVVKNFLDQNKFYLCINENEWQHHFEASNYVIATEVSDKFFTVIIEKKFFKISKKIEIEKWDDVPEFLEKTFLEIIEFIKLVP